LLFHKKIEKIKIVAKDGKEEEMEFKIDAGEVELTAFVNRLAGADSRWHPFLEKSSVKGEHVFRLRYHRAHAMVALSEAVQKTAQNPGNGFLEVARCECPLKRGFVKYHFFHMGYNETVICLVPFILSSFVVGRVESVQEMGLR
jgi:hypothetical protein